MCLAQPHERAVFVVVWHGATIAVTSALVAIAGHSMLNLERLATVDGLLRRERRFRS
jgi:hypothetical protein